MNFLEFRQRMGMVGEVLHAVNSAGLVRSFTIDEYLAHKKSGWADSLAFANLEDARRVSLARLYPRQET